MMKTSDIATIVNAIFQQVFENGSDTHQEWKTTFEVNQYNMQAVLSVKDDLKTVHFYAQPNVMVVGLDVRKNDVQGYIDVPNIEDTPKERTVLPNAALESMFAEEHYLARKTLSVLQNVVTAAYEDSMRP